MPFCTKCGTQVGDDMKFCPTCGTTLSFTQQTQSNNQHQSSTNTAAGFTQTFSNMSDHTAAFSPEDIAQNKVMAILSYIGILVLVPIFAAPKSAFARFHANQGLVLLIAEVIWGVVYGVVSAILYTVFWMLGALFSIIGIVSLVFVVFMILGIVNAASGKAKELPIIGQIKILK